MERPPLEKRFRLAREAITRQYSPEWEAERARFLESNPGLPKKVITAIRSYEIWTGMTVEEIQMSIGPLEVVPDHPHIYRYPSEGLRLTFDSGGYLEELEEI